MFRLNNKAFNILAVEIEKAAEKDSIVGEVAKEIAIKRNNPCLAFFLVESAHALEYRRLCF